MSEWYAITLNCRGPTCCDLETTGLSPRQNEIIQIAAVRVRDGQVLIDTADRFETFVRPGKPIPWFISNLTGIWQSDTRDAPVAEDVFVTC